jgi:raffinose/stachyose/melibiose transport system permease protein
LTVNLKRKMARASVLLALGIVAFLQLAPLVATLLNSLRSDKEIKHFPLGVPALPQFGNYVKAWDTGGYSRAFLNSLAVSLSTTAVVIAAAIVVGYFLARVKSKFMDFVVVYFGVALSIPVFSFLVPVYYRFAEWHLVNTLAGVALIFIATNLPFNVLLARTFVLGIPRELEEAATIDGCSLPAIIGRIVFPMAKPVVTTIALIVAVTTWNEFTIANTFLQSKELKTASTRFVLFVGERGSDLSMIYTAAMVTMIPIVILFIALQNYFIEGMTSGSIK